MLYSPKKCRMSSCQSIYAQTSSAGQILYCKEGSFATSILYEKLVDSRHKLNILSANQLANLTIEAGTPSRVVKKFDLKG